MRRFSGARFPHISHRESRCFTLVELMVALAISIILMAVLLVILSQVTKIWQQVSGADNSRENARFLLQMMGRDLEGAVFPLDTSNTESLWFQMNPSSLAGSGYLNPSAAFWQTSVSGSTTTSGDVQDVGYFVNWIPDSMGTMHGTLCRIQIPPTNSDSVFLSPTRPINSALLANYAPGLNNTDITSPNAYKGLLADNVLGLWIALYATNMAPLSEPYDSRTTTLRPAYADIGVAMVDSGVARHITSANLASITNGYASSTNVESFVNQLPPLIKTGVHAFTTRVHLDDVP